MQIDFLHLGSTLMGLVSSNWYVQTSGCFFPLCVPDPQVVSHVLWTAASNRVSTDNSHSAAATSSQNPSRRPSRHVLLHHDRLAQLSIRDDPVLASPWELYHGRDRGDTAIRWHGLGAEIGLVIWSIPQPAWLVIGSFIHSNQFLCLMLSYGSFASYLMVFLRHCHCSINFLT